MWLFNEYWAILTINNNIKTCYATPPMEISYKHSPTHPHSSKTENPSYGLDTNHTNTHTYLRFPSQLGCFIQVAATLLTAILIKMPEVVLRYYFARATHTFTIPDLKCVVSLPSPFTTYAHTIRCVCVCVAIISTRAVWLCVCLCCRFATCQRPALF